MTDPSPVLIEVDPEQAPGDELPSILVMAPLPTALVEVMPPAELLEVMSPGAQGVTGPASTIPGPKGDPGAPGAQGPIGLSQQPLRIPFDTPMAVWDYMHMLGFPPVVRVLDSAGAEWESEVYTDNNRVTVTHAAPFAGVMLLYA